MKKDENNEQDKDCYCPLCEMMENDPNVFEVDIEPYDEWIKQESEQTVN